MKHDVYYVFVCTHNIFLLINAQLWQFNDAEDTGNIPAVFTGNSSEINSFDMKNLTWTRINFRKSVHNVVVTVAGDNADWLGPNGKIKLKV